MIIITIYVEIYMFWSKHLRSNHVLFTKQFPVVVMVSKKMGPEDWRTHPKSLLRVTTYEDRSFQFIKHF